MLSAVLVQLFGRDVIDRLTLAGFDSADAIASAGSERLAEESGVPVALARRIIAVASEERGHPGPPIEEEAAPPRARDDAVPPAPPAEDGDAARPSDAASPERHVRRPFRRPHHAALTSPEPPAGSSAAR